ncbi:MAG: CoA-binding protein [Deltaproteobacteria bacterium]|nr:MAG: CoA-binding protein [Deltaproteobacteria bacterium]
MDYLAKLPRVFQPESVVVIGASNNPDKLGYHVMKSLVQGGYPGRIYPINPNASELWDLPTFPSLDTVPGDVDLAIIVVPAQLVPGVLEQCHKKGVQGIVLITAGFREIEDPAGASLQERVREMADGWSLPIIGPNTFGFVNLTTTLNASFTPEFSLVPKGGVTLVSQSGGFCHLSAFRAMEENVAFAKIIGLGNRCNMDFSDILPYLADDPDTRVIGLYIEGMDDPRRLLDAAGQMRGRKPVIAYKAGRGETGDDASRFHTGSLAGRYEIYRGAFRQGGILEVGDTEELLDTAKALDSLPPLHGNKVAVLSSQAGPGMIACDICEACGLRLVEFSSRTQERINELLPPLAIRTNPVDMGPAWYSPRAIIGIMEAVIDDPNIDGVVFLAMYASANVALGGEMRKYWEERKPSTKPLVACFSAPSPIWTEDVKLMDRTKGMVFLPTPERAARTMGNLWRQTMLVRNRRQNG